MRKVFRGYAKDKDGNLILIGTVPSLTARTNRLQENAWTKDIWSGKAQQSLRKKQWINPSQSALISLKRDHNLGTHESRYKRPLSREMALTCRPLATVM